MGRGRIEIDTTPGEKVEDWNYFLSSFGSSSDQVSDMGATDVMINDWIGYSSMLGFRYYFNTRMAIDIKGGFMNNAYKDDGWRIQRQKVLGPKMKIDDLPIFSIKFVYGIRLKFLIYILILGAYLNASNNIGEQMPCDHPLLEFAELEGIKAIPIKDIFKLKKLMKECERMMEE